MMKRRASPVEILLEKNVVNQQNSIAPLIQLLIGKVAMGGDGHETNHQNTIAWIKGNFKNYMLNDYPKGAESVAPNPAVEKVTGRRPGLDDFIFKKPNVDEYLATSDPYWVNVNDEFKELMSHVIDYLNTQPKGRDIRGWDVPGTIKNANEWSKSSAKAQKKLAAIADSGGREDAAGAKILMKFPDGFFWVEILDVKDTDMPEGFAERWARGMKGGNFTAAASNPVMRRETILMHHCIGAATGYAEKLHSGSNQYYSLRDPGNMPKLTTEMKGAYINQIYAFGNTPPPKQYWDYIKDYLNHPQIKAYTIENNNPTFTDRAGLLRGKNGYVNRDEVVQMAEQDPKRLAAFNLSREALRKLGLVQFGDKVMKIEDLGDMVKRGKISTRQLKDADLTKEELEKFGLIKTQDGEVRTWSEMAGQTIPHDVVFDALVTPIDFPRGIRFAKSLKFRGYPGDSLPAFEVGGDYEINGGSVKSIGAGTRVGGQLKIESGSSIDLLKDVTCRTLHIGSHVGRLENVRVSAGARFVGNAVEEVGRGCHFGKTFDASKTNIRKISPDAVFMGHVYLMGCPIESFTARRVRGSLLLTESKITSLGSPLTVGFDEAGALLDATYKDTYGGSGCLDLSKTKIKELPKNLTVANTLEIPSSVKVLPSGLKIRQLKMRRGSVKQIPKDMEYKTIQVKGPGTKTTFYYHPDALANANRDMRNQDRIGVDAVAIPPGGMIPGDDSDDSDD